MDITVIVMDHDTASNAIVCSHFPDIHITYCSNHSAKSFHYELNKSKSLSCKCKKEGKNYKHITEALIDRMKTVLHNLISCEEVLKDSNPQEAFSKGLLNFLNFHNVFLSVCTLCAYVCAYMCTYSIVQCI